MSVIGLRVGPFEIVEPADVPEPGEWYRARRTGMTRRHAGEVFVKLLSPDAEGPERAALQTEFDNLRAMEDPRVPEAIALYEGIGALAIAAPDGITLDDIVEARARGSIAMTPATLLDLGLEIAETLQHAHHRTRFHGHLSGANIRLSTAGKVHLFGFGCGPTTSPPPEWSSPERARGEPATPTTDQWSLAALLAGLISGRAPWADVSPEAASVGEVDPILEPIERQWPALSRLFRRMLDPDPTHRYPSMQPVRQELLALSRKAGGMSDKRDLGKLMARRVDRTVAPDSDIPAEFTTHTAPPEAPPGDLTEATEAESAVHTTSETEHVPEVGTETAEAMDIPVSRPPPPVPVEEPPVAPRVDDVEAPDVPLVDEPIDVVHPELDPDDVPEARREGEVDIPGPAADEAPQLLPLDAGPPSDGDEDVDDAPTEKARHDGSGALDPSQKADLESSDVGLPPDEVARALAVDAEGLFGGGPTAVPITDVSDAEVTIPEATPIPPPDVIRQPRTPNLDFEPARAVREDGIEPKEQGSIQRYAPLLVLVMVLLMLGFITLAVW